MSIANLEQPNNFNLFCNSITPGPTSNAFQKYVQTTYNSDITGPFAAPINTSGLYRQIDRDYVIAIVGTSGVSTIAAPITFVTPLSSTNIWAEMNFPIWVIDNGVTVAGNLKIAAGGIMTIYVGFNGNFSNVGTCGFHGFSINYASFIS